MIVMWFIIETKTVLQEQLQTAKWLLTTLMNNYGNILKGNAQFFQNATFEP